MYMGHYAIAVGARRWLRPLPMVWLLFASIEPDLHDVAGSVVPALSIGPDTHTLPGVLCAAVVVALITALCLAGTGCRPAGVVTCRRGLPHQLDAAVAARPTRWVAPLRDTVGGFPAGGRRDHHRPDSLFALT